MLALRNLWYRLCHWEYWPWYVVYIPVFAYWLYCSLRARSLFYMCAANPGFAYGGLIGASKKAILDKLPPHLVPHTLLVRYPFVATKVLQQVRESRLGFPLIGKPDVGERGHRVALLRNEQELSDYLAAGSGDLLLQEYVAGPFEAGVFYCRLPSAPRGRVTSVVIKGWLQVTGDGRHTVAGLMSRQPRARLQLRRLRREGNTALDRIPARGQTVMLEPIGNHVRGTAFLNGNHLLGRQLTEVFDRLGRQIEGFYYGRFDVRCRDARALLQGDFKVVELNGAASEPAHIYAPGYPLLQGWRELLAHWRILYRISRENHRRGVPYPGWRALAAAFRKSRFFH